MDDTPYQIRRYSVGDSMEAFCIAMALRERTQMRTLHIEYLQICSSILVMGYSSLYDHLGLSPYKSLHIALRPYLWHYQPAPLVLLLGPDPLILLASLSLPAAFDPPTFFPSSPRPARSPHIHPKSSTLCSAPLCQT